MLAGLDETVFQNERVGGLDRSPYEPLSEFCSPIVPSISPRYLRVII
jgi:hypothetical protein